MELLEAIVNLQVLAHLGQQLDYLWLLITIIAEVKVIETGVLKNDIFDLSVSNRVLFEPWGIVWNIEVAESRGVPID